MDVESELMALALGKGGYTLTGLAETSTIRALFDDDPRKTFEAIESLRPSELGTSPYHVLFRLLDKSAVLIGSDIRLDSVGLDVGYSGRHIRRLVEKGAAEMALRLVTRSVATMPRALIEFDAIAGSFNVELRSEGFDMDGFNISIFGGYHTGFDWQPLTDDLDEEGRLTYPMSSRIDVERFFTAESLGIISAWRGAATPNIMLKWTAGGNPRTVTVYKTSPMLVADVYVPEARPFWLGQLGV